MGHIVHENLTSELLGLQANESACRVLAVEGGWYATPQVPRVRREEECATGVAGGRRRPGAARILLRFLIRSFWCSACWPILISFGKGARACCGVRSGS